MSPQPGGFASVFSQTQLQFKKKQMWKSHRCIVGVVLIREVRHIQIGEPILRKTSWSYIKSLVNKYGF